MKKFLLFCTALTVLSCSESDNAGPSEPVDHKTEVVSKKLETTVEHGKHKNYLSAEVVNTTPQGVKGYVRFEVKDYGFFNSETETVTNGKTFYSSFESDKALSENDLVHAEFIKE